MTQERIKKWVKKGKAEKWKVTQHCVVDSYLRIEIEVYRRYIQERKKVRWEKG
jgi:hypothetical protein